MNPVPAGTCLLSEEPFVYNLSSKYRTQRCDFCLNNPNNKLFKCSGCCYVYYCGGQCQKAAWSEHKHECGRIKSTCQGKEIPDGLRMMARLVIKLQNNGYTQKSFYTKTEFRKFRDLMSHDKEIQADPTRREYFETCLLPFLGNFLNNQEMPSNKELLQIYGKMAVNSFNILDGEMNSIGTGMYLAASILDHNCEPNAVAVFEGRTLKIRSIAGMSNQNWDKIFISYIDLMDDTETRRKSLKKNYYFLCGCRKCVSHATNDRIMAAAQCPGCEGPYYVDDQGESGASSGCSKCNVVASSQFVKDYEDCTEFSKLHLAEMTNTAYLDMSKICLDKQKSILHSLNLLHVKTLDIAFDSAITLEKFKEAAEFGKALLPGFIYYQGERNPLVGILLLKLGKLFDFLGRVEEAEGYLMDAEKILKVTHGEDHSIYREMLVPLLQATRH